MEAENLRCRNRLIAGVCVPEDLAAQLDELRVSGEAAG
jgi:hypothetical protein